MELEDQLAILDGGGYHQATSDIEKIDTPGKSLASFTHLPKTPEKEMINICRSMVRDGSGTMVAVPSSQLKLCANSASKGIKSANESFCNYTARPTTAVRDNTGNMDVTESLISPLKPFEGKITNTNGNPVSASSLPSLSDCDRRTQKESELEGDSDGDSFEEYECVLRVSELMEFFIMNLPDTRPIFDFPNSYADKSPRKSSDGEQVRNFNSGNDISNVNKSSSIVTNQVLVDNNINVKSETPTDIVTETDLVESKSNGTAKFKKLRSSSTTTTDKASKSLNMKFTPKQLEEINRRKVQKPERKFTIEASSLTKSKDVSNNSVLVENKQNNIKCSSEKSTKRFKSKKDHASTKKEKKRRKSKSTKEANEQIVVSNSDTSVVPRETCDAQYEKNCTLELDNSGNEQENPIADDSSKTLDTNNLKETSKRTGDSADLLTRYYAPIEVEYTVKYLCLAVYCGDILIC